MRLTNVLALSKLITIENLDIAYEEVIKKIRLPHALIPVLVDGGVMNIHNINTIDGVGIRVKDITKFRGVTFDTDKTITYSANNVCNTCFGNLATELSEPYGLNSNDFNLSNKMDNDKSIIPRIFGDKDNTYITNYNEYKSGSKVFFFVEAYVYPFLWSNVSDESYGYLLADIPEEDYDVIEIPSTLVYFMVLKAMSIYLTNEGEIDTSSGYEDLLIRLLTMYNMNIDNPIYNIFAKVGQLNG